MRLGIFIVVVVVTLQVLLTPIIAEYSDSVDIQSQDQDFQDEPKATLETEPLILDKIKEGIKQLKKKFTQQKSLNTNDIKFLLFDPKNKVSEWEVIATGNSSKIKTNKLKAKKPFKIAIHGFLQSCNCTEFPEVIFDAYTKAKSDYNLICVDWGPLANPDMVTQIGSLFHYPRAVNNTLVVGDLTYAFIESLISSGYLSTEKDKSVVDVHLIGHSLGSHIAGVCGHEFYDRNNKKKQLSRITGLDPAGPFFYEKGKDDKWKLGSSDAVFVDVIHSNMGKLGINETLGHVSFIPNGGVVQPFCEKENVLENLAETVTGKCSHASSVGMFAKSIGEKITSCPCNSWAEFQAGKSKCNATETVDFGDKTPLKARGKFCLEIASL